MRNLWRDPIYRVLRKFQYRKNASSYPFISGDTYKKLSDFVFPNFSVFSELDLEKLSRAKNAFVEGGISTNLANFLRGRTNSLSGTNLIIHNGDLIPSVHDFEYLSSLFRRVYSVNWLGDMSNVIPIPIGLENYDYLRNGKPSDFNRLIKKGIVECGKRDISILAAFSLENNPTQRKQALEEVVRVPDVKLELNFRSPAGWRNLIINSRFVLSPPGNGADCHRTWEAIYLGAVPIVKRKFWPFSHLNLPVLIINDWSDLNEMDFSLELYHSIKEHNQEPLINFYSMFI